ncbi:MAG: hypothetical protein IPP71_22800 [Bacteroidetes bacterium]|nr:hypothetical protein [Bacteroidota bacterium]
MTTLVMKAGSKVVGGSDSSFVSGPVNKIGNTEFEFPVGKENAYRPLKISAPTTSTHAFTAEYFNQGQPFGENLDTTLAYIDDCNYWNLTRNVGSSEVFVTLSWESGECPVKDTTYLKIANWYDDNWNDLEHGNITGNYSIGKMTTMNKLTEYGNLAWSYDLSMLSGISPEQYSKGFGFVENLGQVLGTDTLSHTEVLFYGDAGNTALYIQDSIFSYIFEKSHTDTSLNYSRLDSLYRIDLRLLDQNPEYEIQAFDTSQGTRNYFLGQLGTNVTHALSYQEVRIKNCYDGIDLAFNSNDGFKFYVDSDADLSDIKFYYQGNDSVQSTDGIISIYTLFGIKKYSAKSYEYVDGQWSPTDIVINLEDSLISFTIESENRNVPIIISIGIPNFATPVHGPQNKLKWSTYCGGGGNVDELFKDVVIDVEDNIYVVGESIALNFPVTINVVQTINVGDYDVTVFKFKSDRSIDFCTYLGGSIGDFANGIAIDENKNIAIVGGTTSPNFAPCNPPCTGYSQAVNGTLMSNSFISILNAIGEDLLMSTYYSGSSPSSAAKVAFDNANNLIVIGKTAGTIPLPTPNSGFYQDHNGSDDVFIAKFDNAYELVWATHFGGSEAEDVNGLVIDAVGNIYFMGSCLGESTSNLGSPCVANTSAEFPICEPNVGNPFYKVILLQVNGMDLFVNSELIIFFIGQLYLVEVI